MALINPYIHFNGNAEEAFTFYRSVFGGSFEKLSRYKDISSSQYQVPENDANKIMHISLPISKGNMLMGSDVMEVMGRVTETDNRNTIFISAETEAEATNIFNALSESGHVEMPISYGPSGYYFGMLTDKFGLQWMVSFNENL